MKKVTCCDCGKDITKKIQVYYKGVVMCEECNINRKDID